MRITPTSSSQLVGKISVWSVVFSVFMIVAGILAIIVPSVAGIAVTAFVAWLLVLSGFLHFVYAWHAGGTAMIWEVFLGIAYMAAGGYMFVNPTAGMASLSFALATYLLALSLLEWTLALRLRSMPGTGWLFVDGVIALILAIMIWRTWPSSSDWVLGVLVGVSMLFSGITRLIISLAARKLMGDDSSGIGRRSWGDRAA